MSLHQQNKADSDSVSERQPQLEDFAVCAETARANVWPAQRAELKAPGLNVATGAAARIASGHQRGCATESLPVGEGSSGQGKTAAGESRGEP